MSIFTTLASFNGSDGSNPVGKLVADNEGDLFGVTATGGPNDDGVVFEVARAGTGYVNTPIVLADLGGSNGVDPTAGLVIDAAGDLFGVTTSGGTDDTGTIFEVAKTAGSYESSPTVLANFGAGSIQSPIGGLVADANGDLLGTTANAVYELTKTGTSYASQPTTIVNLVGEEGVSGSDGGLVIDSMGNLYGIESQEPLPGHLIYQNIFEIVKSGSSYAATETDLPQIKLETSFVLFDSAQVANLVVDQAGDIFGTQETLDLGNQPPIETGTVFEIVNTASGLASSATTLATFSGSEGRFASYDGLSADGAGDLFGKWDDETFEIVKNGSGYVGTPRILSVSAGPTALALSEP